MRPMVLRTLLVTLFLLALTASAAAGLQEGRKASPFDQLRWNDGAPEVRVEETWYVPLSIEGVAVSEVLAYCEKRWPGQRQKRFAEDLAEAMQLMGHDLPRTVALELRRVSDGEEVTLKGVTCTQEKRQRVKSALSERRERPRAPATISREDALADLAEFGARLRDQFAYLEWKGVDLESALQDIEESLEPSSATIPTPELANHLQRLLMRFGDGHARVDCSAAPRPRRLLPVPRLELAGDGFVAVQLDRSDFFRPSRPFVVAIDGVLIEEWVDAVRPWLADGSEALVRSRAPRLIADLDRGRAALGLEESDQVEVTFARDARGRGKKSETFDVVARDMRADRWLQRETGWLEVPAAKRVKGGVGYVRLPQMDDDLIPELRRAMTEFRDAGGLIVDVRGNGGGQRGLLLALAGYLVDPDEPPVIANVAAYRKSELFRPDHLGGSRHLYRAEDDHWSDDEKATIAAFADEFEPEWKLPDGFSEWHYLLLRPTGDAGEYHFTKPTVVLCDEACFSATDIFLGGLELLPNVTLVGRPSGGGSARVQGFTLPNSQIEVRCASMASFRPDGRTYDGHGVEVDVDVAREPGDLLRDGGDAQLEAAIAALRKRKR